AANYKAILAEGVERLKSLGFSPTSRLETGDAGQKIAEFAEEIGAHLVVVGHRPQRPLARWWFGSVGSYLVKRLRCSVLVAQTEISDDEFEQLKQPGEMPTADPASQHGLAWLFAGPSGRVSVTRGAD